MCYVCGLNSKRVHNINCRYVKRMSESGKMTFATYKEARLSGYEPCKYCVSIRKYLKREKKQIEEYCKPYGIHFFLNQSDASVEALSKSGKWKIVVDDETQDLLLYHYSNGTLKQSDVIPGYHRQNVKRNKLLGYLKYIYQHDKFREAHPLYTRQTNPNVMKGSKKWKKQKNHEDKMRRTQSIRYVTELLNNMALGNIPY